MTTASIAVGDLLARTTSGSQHSQIVVAYDSSAQTALIVDSHYTNGNGNEFIGYHTAGFSATYSGYTLLGNYRDLDCIYSGAC